MRRAAIQATLGLVLLFATAAPTAADDDDDSGIRGYATYGPTPRCAVDYQGEHGCRAPYPGAKIRIRRRGDDDVLRRVRTDRHGRFRVELRPGHYVVIPVDGAPYTKPRRVTVRDDRFAFVRFDYNSGIE